MVYAEQPGVALAVGFPFIAIVVIGFAYEWYSGSLDWVRSSINTSFKATTDIDMAALARRDPETLEDDAA